MRKRRRRQRFILHPPPPRTHLSGKTFASLPTLRSSPLAAAAHSHPTCVTATAAAGLQVLSSSLITGAVCCGASGGRAASTMASATWKGVLIAQTDKFETVEGNVCVHVRLVVRTTHEAGEAEWCEGELGGRGEWGGVGEEEEL